MKLKPIVIFVRAVLMKRRQDSEQAHRRKMIARAERDLKK